MKLKSILFSLLILPLFQSYGQGQSKVVKIDQLGTIFSYVRGSRLPTANVYGLTSSSSIEVTPDDVLMIGLEGDYTEWITLSPIDGQPIEETGPKISVNVVFKEDKPFHPSVPAGFPFVSPEAVKGFPLLFNTFDGSEITSDFRIIGDGCVIVKVPARADSLHFSIFPQSFKQYSNTIGTRARDSLRYLDTDEDFTAHIANLSQLVAGIKPNSLDFLQGPVRVRKFDNLYHEIKDSLSVAEHVDSLVYGKKAVAELVLQRIDDLPVQTDDSFSLTFQIEQGSSNQGNSNSLFSQL